MQSMVVEKADSSAKLENARVHRNAKPAKCSLPSVLISWLFVRIPGVLL